MLASAPYVVSKVDEAEKLDRADAPFKTSTLQQQAAIRLRFAGKRTMKVAQELYEGIDVDGSGPVGLITYMRTDSLRVSDEAMHSVRDLIGTEYGEKYLPAKPIRYAAGKNAQEAHEAIRPTDLRLTPERIKSHLSHDQFRLYQLIYCRFVASQMTPAVFTVTDVAITAGPGLFKAQGKVLKFDGYRRVWPPGGKQDDELLPAPHAPASRSTCTPWTPTQHFTQPPPRYSEATLIKALEKENIGRPSTYAPIIQTIQDRLYVEQKERRFFATDLGMVVTDLLVKHFPKILDLKFTAHMEDELDDIATAKEDMVKVLDEFYYPFQDALKAAETQMERVQIPTSEVCHVCGAPMVLKFGKTGQFLGCSKYPECKATRPLGGQPRAEAVESGHACPKCGKPLLIRENKRGEKFLSCSGYPECKESFNIDAAGQPRALAGGDRARLREVRQAHGAAAGPARAVPGLHRLPQVPQRAGRGRRGQAGPDGQDRREVREVRQADGRPPGPPRRLPRLHRLSQVPRHRPGARGAQGAARRAAPGRPRRQRGARPEDHRGRRDLRRLRQPHGRPPRPPRLLPRLLQVPQVQGHQGAERGHPGEDHRRRGKLKPPR